MEGGGEKRYIKCFCQQFSSFNRKKDQNKCGGRNMGVHECDSMSACGVHKRKRRKEETG